MSRPLARVAGILTALVATVGLAACGSDSGPPGARPRPSGSATSRTSPTPRGSSRTRRASSPSTSVRRKLAVKTFNAGPAAMEALKSGAIDATYVGPDRPPTPTSTPAARRSPSSGAATGGTSFVVDPSIRTAADLKGKKVSTPQLGNTQDIALRYWLKQQGLSSDLQGGGDVSILPQDNATILDAFSQKLIAGAWVPEPYATRMVQAGGKVLVNERDLWPGKKFAITVLAVRTDFLKAHPNSVKALLAGDLDAADFITSHAAKSQQDVGDVIAKVSGKPLKPAVIAAAWKNLQFTVDPVPSSILEGAKHAYAVGILKEEPKLDKLVDLTLLTPCSRNVESRRSPRDGTQHHPRGRDARTAPPGPPWPWTMSPSGIAGTPACSPSTASR